MIPQGAEHGVPPGIERGVCCWIAREFWYVHLLEPKIPTSGKGGQKWGTDWIFDAGKDRLSFSPAEYNPA
jgi:hypothetical protein